MHAQPHSTSCSRAVSKVFNSDENMLCVCVCVCKFTSHVPSIFELHVFLLSSLLIRLRFCAGRYEYLSFCRTLAKGPQPAMWSPQQPLTTAKPCQPPKSSVATPFEVWINVGKRLLTNAKKSNHEKHFITFPTVPCRPVGPPRLVM